MPSEIMKKVLYYPSIEFLDSNWLKSAILLWDKVYRIVPKSYRPYDSEEVIEAVEKDYVRNIVLTNDDLSITANQFIDFSDHLSYLPAGFGSGNFDARIHREKIDYRLMDYFKRGRGELGNDGFIKVNRDIANGYMFFLASTISKRRNIPKMTDNADMYAAMTFFDYEGKLKEEYSSTKNDIAANIIIENVIPGNIDVLSMNDVITISENNYDAKKVFHEKLEILIDNMSQVEDSGTLVEMVNDFRTDILSINREKKKIINSITNKIGKSFLFIGVPLFATSMLQDLLPLTQGVTIEQALLRGVAITGIASISEAAQDIREHWDNRKSNYLLQIKNHLYHSNQKILEPAHIKHLMHEYIND